MVNGGILEIGGAGQLNGGTYSSAMTLGKGATFKYNSGPDQDPTVPNPSAGTFTNGLFSFSKRADATGVSYIIQESTTLSAWEEVGSYTENNASTISHTLTPPTPPKNFLRLKVTEN